MNDSLTRTELDEAFDVFEAKNTQVRIHNAYAWWIAKITNLLGLGYFLVGVELLLTLVVFHAETKAYTGPWLPILTLMTDNLGTVVLHLFLSILTTTFANISANNTMFWAGMALKSVQELCEQTLKKIPQSMKDPDARSALVEAIVGPRLIRINKSYKESNNYVESLLKEHFPSQGYNNRPKTVPNVGSTPSLATEVIVSNLVILLGLQTLLGLIPMTAVLLSIFLS